MVLVFTRSRLLQASVLSWSWHILVLVSVSGVVITTRECETQDENKGQHHLSVKYALSEIYSHFHYLHSPLPISPSLSSWLSPLHISLFLLTPPATLPRWSVQEGTGMVMRPLNSTEERVHKQQSPPEFTSCTWDRTQTELGMRRDKHFWNTRDGRTNKKIQWKNTTVGWH